MVTRRSPRREPRRAGAVGAVDRAPPRARRAAPPAPLVAARRAVGRMACGRAGRGRRTGAAGSGGSRLAGASRSPSRAGCLAGRAAARAGARVFRGIVAHGDRAPARAAAWHREDAHPGRAGAARRSIGPSQGLDAMSDWLGMSASPRSPRPELREHVLSRALRPPRVARWPLAAAALLALAVSALLGRHATLNTQLAALQDTLRLTRDAGPRAAYVPVTVAGREGAVTIFADA